MLNHRNTSKSSNASVSMDPTTLIEEGLASVADTIDERIGKKWWSKFLYPLIIVGVLSVPIIYYYW